MRTESRTRLLLTATITATLAAGLLAGCGGGAAAGGTGALRVGFISTTATPAGPEGWADHKDELVPGLKSAGITSVTWVPFKNGPDLSAALQGGSLDMATLGDTPGLTAKANGIDTRLVNQSAVGQDTWLYGSKGGPTSIDDLKGKTIATQVGSYMYRYLMGMLQQKGIADSVKITHVYTNAAVSALTSGGIAAYAAPAGQLTDAMGKAGFPLLDKASADHTDLLGTSVTVITAKALAAHPSLPKTWNSVRATAISQITADPSAYYAFAGQATSTSAAVVEQSLPVTAYPAEPFSTKGLALLTATNTFLADNKLSKAAVDIDAWKVS